jgi:hypothetical protein
MSDHNRRTGHVQANGNAASPAVTFNDDTDTSDCFTQPTHGYLDA